MAWNRLKNRATGILIGLSMLLLVSCTISYKFNGTVIDYSKIKSIAITDFTNRAAMVYAPLTAVFNEEIRDIYSTQTRLDIVRRDGDLAIEGEIVGYDITPLSIQSSSLAAETRLTLRVAVRYTNNVNSEDDFEKTYKAYRSFESSQLLTDVQDALIEELVEEICNDIYNDTVANW